MADLAAILAIFAGTKTLTRESKQPLEAFGMHLIEYEPTEDVVDGIRRSLAHLDRVAPGWAFA